MSTRVLCHLVSRPQPAIKRSVFSARTSIRSRTSGVFIAFASMSSDSVVVPDLQNVKKKWDDFSDR
jgi:hypothetical protein